MITEPLREVLTEEDCWKAVLARDAGYDGRFFYGVSSTGIYCSPSCPSRRPDPKTVRFFESSYDAERADFRACKRCRPQYAPDNTHLKMVRRLCAYIETHSDHTIKLEDLGALLESSPWHVHKIFKRLTGITPRQYADACRMAKFRAIVSEEPTVIDAMYEVGYASTSRLYERFSYRIGITPKTYKNGGFNSYIYYTITQSFLGRMLVAATEHGVCAIHLGDDDDALKAMLIKEYPKAKIVVAPRQLSKHVESLLAYLSSRLPAPNLPLHIRTTAFKRLVWQELLKIPSGETRSYSQIAKAIERPNAARSVTRLR